MNFLMFFSFETPPWRYVKKYDSTFFLQTQVPY